MTNKTALITGASSGIGKELAILHAKNGDNLVLVARRVDKLNRLKEELERQYAIKVSIFEKDLSQVGAALELYDEVKFANIKIEYLINNAGFGLLGKFHELDWTKHFTMINLNMTALTELTHLFLPDFIEQGGGKILNTSSTASLVPGPLHAVYYASKAYVTSFGNALAEEYYDKNITVTNLLPGATETEFGAVSGMDKSKGFAKTVTAKSVAQDGFDAMMRGELDSISGLTTMQKIMLWMLPFIPKRMLLKNVREFQEAK